MAASFPSALKTFTTKVDGTTAIEAAHINDLQLEVTAIETELGINSTNAAARATSTGNATLIIALQVFTH